jgi:hypothetical protein
MTWLQEEQIQAVVDFWDKQLIPDDRRQQFRHAVRAVLVKAAEAPGSDRGALYFKVDYDPQQLLLEAVRAAGIECRGFMFSADGLFRCRKTYTRVMPRQVKLKEGYGAGEVWLWREPSPHDGTDG